MSNEVAVTTAAPEPQWAAFCGPRLGRSEALLETGRGQFPEAGAGAGRIGQHARSGGGLGRGFERTFRRSADRRVSGAGAGRVGVYAVEVPALGAVPGEPPDGGPLPASLLPVRLQGRSCRHQGAAGHPVTPSRPVTAPEAGYTRDAPVAAVGGTAAADGE